MDLALVVGSTFVNHFTDAKQFPLLVIGKDRWSYQEVASLGVIQPRACRILSKIASDLKVTNTKDFYKQTSPYLLAGMAGCGVTTLFVALQAFTALGLDTDAWYVRGEQEAVRTFNTLKHRELKAERKTVESERKRRRLRSTRQVRESERAVTHDRSPRRKS
jgi:hypothetical protein